MSVSTSQFSDSEILQECEELGIRLPPDQLANLKKELDALLSTENFDAHSDQQSAPTGNVLRQLNRMHDQSNEEYRRLSTVPGDNLANVLKQADQMTDIVEKDVARVEALLSTLDRDPLIRSATRQGGNGPSITLGDAQLDRSCACVESPCVHERAIQELRQALAADGMTEEEINSTLVPVDELHDLQSSLIQAETDPLKIPTLRPLATLPPYGQLIYRNDPVARHELYAKEWAKYPIPGEDKRKALRWKVREYMLRHDCLM